MRLKSVFISNYKNLKNFDLTFEGDGFLAIFVGRNGSGKSNFLEALIEIFNHLYGFDPENGGPGFGYRLTYEIDGREVLNVWDEEKLTIDGRVRRTLSGVPLPDSILVYYSGQNTTVGALIRSYEDVFRSKIKTADFGDRPEFIGIGPDYRRLLIAILLLQPDGSLVRQYLCNKLGISRVGSDLRLTLTRPIYARGSDSRRYDIDDVDGDRFWKPAGITRDFLERLIRCQSGAPKDGRLRSEGYFQDPERYILYLDTEKLKAEFLNVSPGDLFQQFNNLKILGMLADISMIVWQDDIEIVNLDQFSDGQFQSVYLFAISELFKDRNCITLLDEPDAFLHPEWQFDFLNQTHAISEKAAKTNHILMTSHSAATLISDLDKSVKYFDLKAGRVICYPLPKRVVIEKLSSKLIKYSEQEQLLSIIHTIQFKKKPVFFTEGSVDPLILREAWDRLYTTEMPFIPFYAFSCTYLSQLLRDDRIFNEMGEIPVFGLFDLDEAYDQWNGLKGNEIQPDLTAGKIKKIENRSAYAVLLPVPANTKIRSQIMAPDGTFFGGKSLCEIEHLFYGDPKTDAFFESKPTIGGGTTIVIKSDKQKHQFASEVIPTLDDHYFEVFRPIFEFVRSKTLQ
ncbi:ATP-dependent nuclease [Rhizobium leguminosarum]